jgi:hypothetical protein
MSKEPTRCVFCSEPAEERHHIAGKQNDPTTTVDLCRSCHAQTHRDMGDLGVQLDGENRSMLERLVMFLRSLGAFFLELGKRMLDWANLLASILGRGHGPAAEGAT